MAIRTLTYALAAAAMTLGTTAQAAAPAPARNSAPVGEAEQLNGGPGLLPVLVLMLAVLSIIVFVDDNEPSSP